MKIPIIILSLALTGCANTQISAPGSKVRIVDISTFMTGDCEFIEATRVKGQRGAYPVATQRNKLTAARNGAAVVGANTVVVNFSDYYGGVPSTLIDVEYYNCPRSNT